jgi:hypothetical protein
MRDSLLSDIERVRHLTVLEVYGVKVLLFILSALLLTLTVRWKRFCHSALIQRICKHPCQFYFEGPTNRILNRSFLIILIGMLVTSVHILFGKQHWNPTLFRLLNTEDGIVETASALLFLFCSIVSLATLPLVKNALNRKVVLILFAIGFFLCFGEEISWGQRIFSFQTPEFMSEVNVQNEVNLHNMFGVLSDHLFLVAIFTYGVVLPLLQRLHPFWRSLLSMLGLPMSSLGLVVGFVMISCLQTAIIWKLLPFTQGMWIKEIRELLMALGLLLLLFEYRQTLTQARES